MQNVIVGIGEILWDFLPSGKILGGAPANFAYHAQEFGECSAVVSCVGDDELGQEIIYSLENRNISKEFLHIDKKHSTGASYVKINKEGNPSYLIKEGVAWDYIPSSTLLCKLASKSAAVCFGTIAQRSKLSRMTIHKFLESMGKETIRVFDLNLRQNYYSEEIIKTSMRLANVLKLNVNELSVVKKILGLNGDEQKIISELSNKYSLHLVALTKGSAGSILFSEGKIFKHEGFIIDVKDTVGAGDAFVAALVIGLLRGYEIENLHNKANLVASYICTRNGATPSLTNEILNLFK